MTDKAKANEIRTNGRIVSREATTEKEMVVEIKERGRYRAKEGTNFAKKSPFFLIGNVFNKTRFSLLMRRAI